MHKEKLLPSHPTSGGKLENKLLKQYRKESPGLIFKEVTIKGTRRRIDAIRIVNTDLPDEIISWRETNAFDFQRALYHPKTIAVEVIEIKSVDLNGDVIGQVVAGADLFQELFPRLNREIITRVVIGAGVDELMRKVSERYHIKIWPDLLDKQKRRKASHQLTGDQQETLKKYYHRFGGRIFTGVIVFNQGIDAVRVESANLHQDIMDFGSFGIQDLTSAVQDPQVKAIEIIRVLPGHFGRSAFGQLLTQAALFEIYYQEAIKVRPEIVKKVLIRMEGDRPMEKVCRNNDIIVWPSPTEPDIRIKMRR